MRARTTIVAVTAVSVALVAGAIALVTILRVSLRDGIDRAATTRAQDVAGLIRSGSLPSRLAFPGEETTIIQVVDARGVVIATTANVEGKPAISDRPGSDPPVLFDARVAPVDEYERLRVAALSVDTAGGAVTVYSGESTDDTEETVDTIASVLLIGTPALVVVVGLVTWRNARRALEPVHRIIGEVDAITEGAPHARIAPPGTDDEIGELATTMNAMLERLDRFSIRQRRFTADASHELRSPLASLRTQLEVAVAHPAGIELDVIAADLLADVGRLEQLATGLLDLARLDSGPVHHEPIDLRDVITDVLASTASTRRTPCRVDMPSEPVVVAGDRRQLEGALRNLLDNADRYATSHVEVLLRMEGDRFTLEVIDDGPGVGAEDRQRIFERFTRLDDSRARDHGGAGLGLAIVDEIVRSHHGRVEASDPPTGTGTRFRIELPRNAT